MGFRIDSLLLTLRSGNFYWRTVGDPPPPPPPPPPPAGDITPVLKVSHATVGGARTTTTVAADGSTVITGVAPVLLFMDARETRCSATADNELDAWWHLRYRMDYDEAPGQTWPISGKPYEYDVGEPLFARVEEAPGTKTYVLTVDNAEGGQATRTLTVIATAPPTPTIIETSAGSWPAWVDGTHYQLRGDGNYSSFGDIAMGGHQDIVISKVGAGADPIVSGFNPDSRDFRTILTVEEPSTNIRLVDIDVGRYFNGTMGPRYCGCVRGRVRTFDGEAFSYYYEWEGTTLERRANLRIPRGVFLWKTGEMYPPSGSQYVMITTLREFVAQDVVIAKNGLTGNHAIRNYGKDHIWRHSQIYAVGSAASLVKHQAGDGQTPWTDNEDTVGTPTGTPDWEHRPAEHFVMADMVYHTPTSTIPDICVGAGAENNDVGYGHGCIRFCSFSRSRSARNEWQSVAGLDVQVNGQGHSTRDVRLLDGTPVTQSSNAWVNNIPVEWRGPNLYETTDSRDSY